ncbi:MAG: stage II sporulation protein D [Oscillospiraceae bacterium]|nr:stage II sporulation protein D [Oscillospiraceae bacterium]
MKRLLLVAIITLLILFLFPLFLLGGKPASSSQKTPGATLPAATLPANRAVAEADANVAIRLLSGGKVSKISLDKYLWGVVAAEMPASFAPEALKAQAVAARTYTLYQMVHGPNKNHQDADVCGDYRCCSAYISREQALKNWGQNAQVNAAKISQAISQTDGQVVLYQGAPIDAVFHSSSSGSTEDASRVWGAAVPYLKSVSSPESSDSVPNYYSTFRVSAADFKASFLKTYPKANLSGDPAAWFQNEIRSPANKVLSLEVGGVKVKGVDLRTMFSLRSTSFRITISKDQIVFSVTGYGHGVGLSQYGSNAMAKAGKTYDQILKWYYSGTVLGKWTDVKRR